MPSSKRLTSYPDWLLTLAGRFEAPELRKEYIIPCNTPAEAMRYRQNIYGFLRALEREGMFKDYPNFQSIRLVIRGNDLHILHVDKYLPEPQPHPFKAPHE